MKEFNQKSTKIQKRPNMLNIYNLDQGFQSQCICMFHRQVHKNKR